MTLNRRNFMVGSAAVAGVAMAAPFINITPANSAVPLSGKQNAGFYRTRVGNIEVTSLLDGTMTLGDSLMVNTTPQELAQAKENNFIKAGVEFPAFVNAYVINTGKKIILVDTGARGLASTLGHISENLAAAGFSIDMIDEVIITHAHPDHTNGLINNKGDMVFPNAKIRISVKELAYWYDDTKMNAAGDKKQMFDVARKNLGPYQSKGSIDIFQSNADLGGGVNIVDLFGHTPGHSGVRVSDGKEQLLIWGDIIHVPALQFANPKVSIAFDVDIEAARKTRLKILDEVSKDRIRVAGMHLAFPAFGHVATYSEGYNFVPQAWENLA